MARIVGESGTTNYLKRKTRRFKLEETSDFEGIKKLKENFNGVVNRKTDEIKAQFSTKQEQITQQEAALLNGVEDTETLPRKTRKKVKKLYKTSQKLTKKEDKTINKQSKRLTKAKNVIERESSFYYGSIGEEAVIAELCELPDTYYILNDVKLDIGRSIVWKKYGEWVRSSQVDHIVIGPKGVFLIETKNWNPATLRSTYNLPHKQIDRASYIFFILISTRFRRKLPVYNVVATYRPLPIVNYPYVNQLNIKELNSFILSRYGELHESEIEYLLKRLRRYI